MLVVPDETDTTVPRECGLTRRGSSDQVCRLRLLKDCSSLRSDSGSLRSPPLSLTTIGGGVYAGLIRPHIGVPIDTHIRIRRRKRRGTRVVRPNANCVTRGELPPTLRVDHLALVEDSNLRR